MIEQVSLSRSLSALLQHSSHRSHMIRKKVAKFLLSLTKMSMTIMMMKSKGHELLASSKDFPVFKASVSRLIQDSTPEARAYCRDIVRMLIDQQVVSRYEWEQLIPVEVLEKALSSTGGITSSIGQVMSTVGSSKQSGVLNNNQIHDSLHRSSNDRGKRDKSHVNEEQQQQQQLLHNHLLSPHVSHNSKCNLDLHSLIKSTDKMSSILEDQALTSSSPAIINNASTATATVNNKPAGSMYLDTAGTEDLLRGGLWHQQLPSNRKHHHQASSSSTTTTTTAAAASINSIIDTKNTYAMISPTKMDLAMTMNAKRVIEQDQELSNLSELLQNTTVRAWTERNVALDSLTALMIRHYNVLRDANKLSICLEHVLNRLEDGMVKVW